MWYSYYKIKIAVRGDFWYYMESYLIISILYLILIL